MTEGWTLHSAIPHRSLQAHIEQVAQLVRCSRASELGGGTSCPGGSEIPLGLLQKGAGQGDSCLGSAVCNAMRSSQHWRGRGGYPRFLVDNMLGKAVRWLRNLGMDAEYQPSKNYSELLSRLAPGERVLLTQDRRLLCQRSMLELPWLYVPSKKPKEQVKQVLEYFKVAVNPELYMTRCVECNNDGFRRLERPAVAGRVPRQVQLAYEEFWECPNCSKIFWEGTTSVDTANRLDSMAGFELNAGRRVGDVCGNGEPGQCLSDKRCL